MTLSDSAEAVFEADSLRCARGGRTVIDAVGFRVSGGEALRLTGPNGSGKTTLLRVLAGLAPPAAGDLRWRGALVFRDLAAHRERVLYVGHQDAVKPWLSVHENLVFWCGMYRDADTADLTAALQRFGLGHAADVPARFLSVGQRRRLNLARLGVLPARIWLLDEPGAALDSSATAALEEAIERHCASGGLVVAATHTALSLPGANHLSLDAAS